MLIIIHIIKTFVTNRLNCGEDGFPKDVDYNGVLRNRYSSQSIKKVWRKKLNDVANDSKLKTVNTRNLGHLFKKHLLDCGYPEEEAFRIAKEVIDKVADMCGTDCGKSKREDPLATKVILPLNQYDIEYIIQYMDDELEKIEDIGEGDILNYDGLKLVWNVTVDAALFGRMLAGKSAVNVPSSTYVGHAFSTHAAVEDKDDFTATDKLIEDGIIEKEGAAHLDSKSFTSSCMYQCVVIDTDIMEEDLKEYENRDEIIRNVISEFLPTIALNAPSGGQHGMFSNPIPSAFLVEVQRNKVANDLSGAFEIPIKGSNITYDSVTKLKDYYMLQDRQFGFYKDFAERLWLTTEDVELPIAEKMESLKELTDRVCGCLLIPQN